MSGTSSRRSAKLSALNPNKQEESSPPPLSSLTSGRPASHITNSKPLPRTPSAPPLLQLTTNNNSIDPVVPEQTSSTRHSDHSSNNLTSAIAPFLYVNDPNAPSGTPPLSPSQGPGSSPILAPANNTFLQHHHSFDHLPDSLGGDQVWTTIESLVLPLFIGQGLNSTIEEVNILLSRYISQQLYGTILEELKDLLRDGVHRLMANFLTPDIVFPPADTTTKSTLASHSLYLLRWTDVWTFYFSIVLPYLQSIFLPLQVEINNSRLVYSVRLLVLMAFRDCAVIPNIDSIHALVESLSTEFNFFKSMSSNPGGLSTSLQHSPIMFHSNIHISTINNATSSAVSPPIEIRIATLHQMLIVIKDLPVSGTSISGGSKVGNSLQTTVDDSHVKIIRALQNALKNIIACIRNSNNATTSALPAS